MNYHMVNEKFIASLHEGYIADAKSSWSTSNLIPTMKMITGSPTFKQQQPSTTPKC